MFCYPYGIGHLPRPAVGLIVGLLLAFPVSAQLDAGAGLALLRLYGSDDDRWHSGFAASVGLQWHEQWWAEAVLVHRPWQSFQTQESYRSLDPGRLPTEIYRMVDGRSDWLQGGLALRGIAVPVGGRRRHLQYYGRLEAGWLVYRYRLNRPDVPAGYAVDLPLESRWTSVYLQPGAGLEWLYGWAKPFMQVGACLPLVRPEVPPGSNLALTSTFSAALGLRLQLTKR